MYGVLKPIGPQHETTGEAVRCDTRLSKFCRAAPFVSSLVNGGPSRDTAASGGAAALCAEAVRAAAQEEQVALRRHSRHVEVVPVWYVVSSTGPSGGTAASWGAAALCAEAVGTAA